MGHRFGRGWARDPLSRRRRARCIEKIRGGARNVARGREETGQIQYWRDRAPLSHLASGRTPFRAVSTKVGPASLLAGASLEKPGATQARTAKNFSITNRQD